MVTYSDMVTLLLTFFVLLISMSDIDKIKFDMAAGSLKGAFGVFEQVGDDQLHATQFSMISPENNKAVQRVYKRIRDHLDRLDLNRQIEVVKDRGAVILRIKDSVLFESGESDLDPESHSVLQQVADLVRPWPLDMRIEGHTDNVPVTREGMSNWDLSVERALSVLKFFAKRELLPLERLSAVGYGSQHPVVPNDSPRHRAMNRRVDFVLESSSGYQEELPYLIDTRYQLPF
jgi:chemotaxis protein MotB